MLIRQLRTAGRWLRETRVLGLSSVVPPEDDEDGKERQGGPLIQGEVEPQAGLGADGFRHEAVDEVGDDVELDELAAKQVAAQQARTGPRPS